jgi:RNA polymerase sigma factor (sigma-70 family)
MREQMRGAGEKRLDEISTEWSIVRDPAEFVKRYQRAIRKYLGALIRNPHDAEEVLQDFFLRVSQNGFIRAKRERGRFRDYLKAAVRNAAINFHRRTRFPQPMDSAALQKMIADIPQQDADQVWIRQWQKTMLERAMRALKKHQKSSPGNLSFTVLDLIAAFPHESTKKLAERTSGLLGRPIRPDAFRKQVSRARRMLARALVQEIAQTLDEPSKSQVLEEFRELELWPYVSGFLPSNWTWTKPKPS